MGTIRKYWSSFVAFSASLMSLFSGILVSVPSAGNDNNPWYDYGKFLVAVCIGLWFVPEHTWNRRTHKWAWWTCALVLVIFSSGFVLGYTRLVSSWSLNYYGQRVLVGETLTPTGKRDLKLLRDDGRNPNDFDLLERALGDAKAVWRPEEIESRQHELTLLYLAALFLLASTVVTVAQAAYCSTRTR